MEILAGVLALIFWFLGFALIDSNKNLSENKNVAFGLWFFFGSGICVVAVIYLFVFFDIDMGGSSDYGVSCYEDGRGGIICE
jgi:hypothetical protein